MVPSSADLMDTTVLIIFRSRTADPFMVYDAYDNAAMSPYVIN